MVILQQASCQTVTRDNRSFWHRAGARVCRPTPLAEFPQMQDMHFAFHLEEARANKAILVWQDGPGIDMQTTFLSRIEAASGPLTAARPLIVEDDRSDVCSQFGTSTGDDLIWLASPSPVRRNGGAQASPVTRPRQHVSRTADARLPFAASRERRGRFVVPRWRSAKTAWSTSCRSTQRKAMWPSTSSRVDAFRCRPAAGNAYRRLPRAFIPRPTSVIRSARRG
jgi:hypothetical protein